jgi:transmembrane sensor
MHPETPHQPEGAEPASLPEQQAADWLVRQDAGLTPAQQEEFNGWLNSDPQHAAVYGELVQTWSLLGRVSADLTAATPAARPARSRRRWLPLGVAAAAAAAAIAYVSWPAPAPSATPFVLTASTEVGKMRKVPLPDGSTVQLNTDTAIAVQFTATERRVRLVRGEAHFQVAKNPARPFIVGAGVVAVRAVGTAFDVRRRAHAVEILVTEGKVRVDDTLGERSLLPAPAADSERAYLLAGQRVSIRTGPAETPAPPRVEAVAPAEISQTLAWQSHRLEFVATPLADIVEEFNRYNRHKLVIADPRLATRRFGGTFPAGDYEEFVRLLEADFSVVAERGDKEIRLRLAQ